MEGTSIAALIAVGIVLIPVIDRPVMVDIRPQSVEIPSATVLTKDRVPINLRVAVEVRIVDPLKNVLNVANFKDALQGVTVERLGEVIGDVPSDEVVSRLEQVIDDVRPKLDEILGRWGGELLGIEIQEVTVTSTAGVTTILWSNQQATDEAIARLVEPDSQPSGA